MRSARLPTRESNFARLMWNVYERLPLAMDDVIDPAHHRLSTLARRQLPLIRATGAHPRTGAATCVIVADPAPSVDYFLESLVGDQARRESLGDVHLHDLVDALDRHAGDASLLIARIDHRLGDHVFPAGWTCIPESVNTRMPVPEDGLVNERARKSQQDNIRKIRKHSLTYEISHDMVDFDHFYHELYVPFVLNRHGGMGYVRGYHRLRRYMRHGGIMWVLRDNQRVMGELFFIRDDVLHWVCRGTLRGGYEPLQYGAGSAIYVMGVAFARQRGVRSFDMGDSRPSLADGVLRHKLRWGGTIRPSARARRDLRMRWPGVSEEIACFLADTIPIVRVGRELVALTADAPETGRPGDIIDAPGIQRIETIRREV